MARRRLGNAAAACAVLCIAALPAWHGASAAARLNDRLCIVPVLNGAPSEADIGDLWRMVSRIVPIPGVSRPVIYATNRGGVWTVDGERRFVRFGGAFPNNAFWDKFAHDPQTGRTAGVSNSRGLFVIDAGETQFRELAAADRQPLRHPYDISFIARFDGFVIVDASGLYLLDRNNVLSALPISDPSRVGLPFSIHDLPDLGALVISSQGRRVSIRFDDGEVVPLLTLEGDDFVQLVSAAADKTLMVTTHKWRYTVALPARGTTSAPPATRGERPAGPITPPPPARSLLSLTAPSIGMTLRYHDAGLREDRAEGARDISLPFDARQTKITGLAELPASRHVLVLTTAGAYALDPAGTVTRVPGAEHTPLNVRRDGKGLIPVRNELLLTGPRALYVAVDRMFAGDAACAPADRAPPPSANICLRRAGDFDDRSLSAFSILGLAPSRKEIVIRSQNGPIFLWKPGGELRPLSEAGAIHAQALHPLPWTSREVLITARTSIRLDDAGTVRKVGSGELRTAPELLAELRSIDTLVFKQGGGTLRLTPTGGFAAYGSALSPQGFDRVVDAPWWKGGVANGWRGLKLLHRDREMADLPLTYRGVRLPSLRAGTTILRAEGAMHALPRLRAIVLRRAPEQRSPLPAGWVRIDENFAVHPLPELPPDAEVLTVHDIDDGPILLGSSHGLFAAGTDGEIVRVSGAPASPVRAIARLAGTGDLLIGGDAGLFLYRDGSVRHLPAHNDKIGAVQRFVEVPFASLTIVEASLGAFVLDAAGAVQSIPALAPNVTRGALLVVPELAAVYTLGKGAVYTLGSLQELGRRDRDGACNQAL